MESKKRILIVDDSFINRGALSAILEEEYDIVEAENGKEALDIIEHEKEEISAVLLDLIMPIMDGYQFLKMIKKNPLLMNIPVIVMTQIEGEDYEIKALTLGAADFLVKPYKAMIIKQRLANILQLRETAALLNIVEHDALTGIFNRNTFYKEVEQLLTVNTKGKYNMFCVDVERFKIINDLFGMTEGDKLLCYISNRVKMISVRYSGICGRLGNDIFAVCIEQGHEKEVVEFMLDEIKSYPLDIAINLRFGIYLIHDIYLSVSAMCDRAKLAIESIKGKYDQNFAYYDDKQRQKLLKEQEILNDMHMALREEQFEIFLQPKYNLLTEKPEGAEVLVRWRHPKKGLVPPIDFIPVFEKNGFILKMDYYVWEKACKLIHRWKSEGKEIYPISVNVSRVNLYNPLFCENLFCLVEKYGILPEQLNLEVTESAYTDNPDMLIRTIGKLQDYGFVIMMDDFGSGYSSLNILKDIPVDILKIDLKFLYGNDNNDRGQIILSSVVQMAMGLGLPAIAEGVETKEQAQFLSKIGCSFVQGFYYARPMPVEEYEKLIYK